MKKLVYIVVGLGLLGGGALAARSGYRYWKQEHLVNMANAFLTRSDTANAILCLQRALQSNPSNVEACRMFASLAEKAGSRNAIWWRRRVVELEPKELQNRVDWAKSALVLGDLAAANEALASIDEKGRQTAEYHKAVGSLAWAQNKYAESEAQYVEALRLEPTNSASQLNLAIARLVVDNGAKANEARARLETLRTNDSVGQEALRQLTQDAMRHHAIEKAVAYAHVLQQDAKCRFADRLLYLEALRQARSPQFAPCLSSLQSLSATNSRDAFEVVGWMAHHGAAKNALSWSESLAPTVRTNMPLPLIVADSYASIGDWESLEAMLKSQEWGDMDYARHLLDSRALRAQGNTLAASVEWRRALKAASQRVEGLNDLVRRTAAWNWGPELDETLWAIVDNFPIEKGAFLALYDRLYEAGNTPALHNLLAKVSAFVPLNTELKNNLAVVSLLVYPRGQHGHDLAREVYADDPQNAFYLSTYAYSLHLQGKSSEALKLLESLKKEEIEKPVIAAYYGIILASTGDYARARPYLALGLQAKLLPEEKNLITRAGAGM